MKKYIPLVLCFIFAFFLFSSYSFALTRSFTVDESQFSLVSSQEFSDLLDYVSSNPPENGVSNYIIFKDNNNYIIYYSSANFIFPIYFYNNQNPSVPHFAWGTLQYVNNQYVSAQTCIINISPYSYSNCTNMGSNYQHFIEVNETTLVIDYSTFLYSSYDLNYPGGTTFEISLRDYTYTFGTNEHLPSLYEFYNLYRANDDYPILTSFYSIFINKLSLLCDYITSNYVLLSIFVILIFFYSILLFRRLKQ